ncbi:S41 family peptidase [Tuwongella immobilis]
MIGTIPVAAEEPIRFPRTPSLSPDAKTVAFSYRGDIWTVPSEGGMARPLTQHEAHDVYPVFSPDGKWIAFSSNRFGSYDVFVMPVVGGRPTRLTFDSNADVVRGWTADSKNILFRSSRAISYPSATETYSIPLTGGAETQLPAKDAKELTLAPDGSMVFVRGSGDSVRKGYRGSSNDDLWLAGPGGKNPRKFTTFDGQDIHPIFAPNGRALYYVSEKFGTPGNIVSQAMQPTPEGFVPTGDATPLTQHKDDAVREMHLAANGSAIVYECGTDIHIVNTSDKASRKLKILAYADDKTNPERTTTYSRDISEYEISPDEKSVAFVVRGEIFLTPVGSSAPAKQLTDWPGNDGQLAWAPDGKSLVFVSDRGVTEDLYVLKADPDGPLAAASKFVIKRLTNTAEPEGAVSFSPDGKRIVFIADGRLKSIAADGTDPKTLVDEPQVGEYEWSPDGKWMVVGRTDGSLGTELYLMPSSGGEMTNLTRYATRNSSATWSKSGHKLAFLSDRRSQVGLYVMSLQKPGADAKQTTFDLDEVHLRVNRITTQSVGSVSITPDGSRVVYAASAAGSTPGAGEESDLWVASAEGRSMTRLTTGNLGPRAFRFNRSGTAVFFLSRAGELRVVPLGGSRGPIGAVAGGPASGGPGGPGGPGGSSGPMGSSSASAPAGEPGRIPLTARLTTNTTAEFLATFDQGWRILADGFYDSTFHGTDWNKVREKLRPAVEHITDVEDFYALVQIMLGELNASHLGISGRTRQANPDDSTADLGLLFDPLFAGPGLKVLEVVRRGPADRVGIEFKPGDVITHLDDVELGPTVNVSKLLNGKSGSTITVKVVNPTQPKAAPRTMKLTAGSRAQMAPLMYARWVRQNEEMVAKLSKGSLGYIHIPSMDENGLEAFVRSLYSDNFNKDAIVLDVRYNGGGFTHDQVLNYLTGKPHTIFRNRSGGEGTVMRNYDRKWSKPLILLTNHRSYSDAEIFPHAFRTLGLGKLVGTPTSGAVIGTVQRRLLDGSSFRLPRTGVFTVQGVNMEKEGVKPDYLVETTSEDVLAGRDPQISKAVEVLLGEVSAWKKANPTPNTTAPKPTISSTSPMPKPATDGAKGAAAAPSPTK